jgi:RNA polymerase sigma-70 factor (ECF subfamily)
VTTGRQAELAAAFHRARPRLVRVAYAVLGSGSDAEDVVSDAWLRLESSDQRERVRDVEGWGVVAVARLALDLLTSARVRRERYVGPWLPEPIVQGALDPADRVTLDESVSYALMVVLETLSPAERTAWVLHDLFGMPFAEVADTVGRSPAAVRQLAARARRHVSLRAPRLTITPSEHDAVVAAFTSASAGGDLAALLEVLDPDVVLTSDGGPQVNAARRPVVGAERVSRFVLGITQNIRAGQRVEPVTVNGSTGLALYEGDHLSLVVSITVIAARITRLDLVLAPEKLPH